MLTIRQTIPIQLSYPVHFTHGLFEDGNTILADLIRGEGLSGAKKVLVVIDAGVLACHEGLLRQIERYAKRHSDAMALAHPPLRFEGGEAAKNDPAHLEEIYRAIDVAGICRHSYVLAIGGGAVLDMVGFAAATAHRGVRLIRVPTTVLAQNDSGVGVKNGVNRFGKKNYLGAFCSPHGVLNDSDFLDTLEDRDWRSGISEAIKVSLLKDPFFYKFIRLNALKLVHRNKDIMEELIYRCAKLHLDHIATGGDPFELGSSRPLDFGHWAAHKLENLTQYRLRHGEAVAIGIALDTTYSHLKGYLAKDTWKDIINMLSTVGFSLYIPELSAFSEQVQHPESVFRGIEEFREHLGGRLTLTMLGDIGKPIEVNEVDIPLFQQAIALLQEIQSEHQMDFEAQPMSR